MRVLFLICLLSTVLPSKSEDIRIQGIIIDSETDQPIPFVHVVMEDVVMPSNLEGLFTIEAHSTQEIPSFQVSAIGYETKNIKIDPDKDYYKVYMTPSVTELSEVTVLTGGNLMWHVFNRFHINYHMSRQQMLGYYKEHLTSTDSSYYLAEGIMDIYVPSNIENRTPLANPIRTRKKVYNEIREEVTFLDGNVCDMAKSSIWRKNSFLSQKNRNRYQYYYEGVDMLDDQEIYLVSFEPKSNKGNKANTTGIIHIDQETFAIVKLEYFPKLNKTHWASVSWVEEYTQANNGVYELFKVSYDGSWEGEDQVYRYTALLMINESMSLEEMPDLQDDFLTETDPFFYVVSDEDFSETFWDGYQGIEVDARKISFLKAKGVTVSK